MNKYFTLLLFCYVALTYSCENKSTSEVTKESGTIIPVSEDTIAKYFYWESDYFAKHFSNKDSLIFQYRRAFDTCWNLSIAKSGDFYLAHYFYYPPSYYKDFPTLQERRVFLFKGITIMIDQTQWTKLASALDQILIPKISSTAEFEGLIHPPFYKMYYRNKLYSTAKGLQCNFYQLDSILRTYLIENALSHYPIINGRVP